jgi:hypothetical protein
MASPNTPHPGAGAYSNAAEIAAQLQGRAAAVLPSAMSVVRHYAMLLETQIKANASGRPGPNAPTGAPGRTKCIQAPTRCWPSSAPTSRRAAAWSTAT